MKPGQLASVFRLTPLTSPEPYFLAVPGDFILTQTKKETHNLQVMRPLYRLQRFLPETSKYITLTFANCVKSVN